MLGSKFLNQNIRVVEYKNSKLLNFLTNWFAIYLFMSTF